MMTPRLSLKYKLLALLVILPTITLGLYLLLVVNLFERDKEAYVFDSSVSVSRTLSAQVRSLLTAETSIMRTLLKSRGPDGKFTQEAQISLKGESEVEYLAFLTPDATGEAYSVFSDLRNPGIKDAVIEDIRKSDTEDAIDAKNHDLKLRLLNKESDLILLTMRFGEKEDPKSIIARAYFHAPMFFEAFKQTHLYTTYLIGGHGQVILGSETENIHPITDLSQWKFFKEFSSKRSPEGTASITSPNNEDLLASYTRVGSNDMFIISFIPKKVVFRAIQIMLVKSILFFIGLILMSLIVSILASSKLTANLSRLMAAMKRAASGDLGHRFEIKSGDEFSVVGGVFNQMTGDLEKSREDLLELNRSLEQKVKERTMQLEEIAIRDALTGLYNRRYFNEKLKEEIARSQRNKKPIGIVYMDIDHFKKYNDGNGHPQGDVLLKMFSKVAGETIRKTDFLCRLGGEEFCVILPETNIGGAAECGEKIRKAIETTNFPCGEKQPMGRITCSLGVSAFPDFGKDEESLIKVADECLYRVKEGGRNAVGIPPSAKM